MATSGSTDFELAVDDYIEEAFERCGLEIRTGYDLRTAKRSLNLMFADWANRGLNRWTIAQTSITLSQGRPTQYYVDRQVTPKFRVFPTPNTTYTLVVDRLTRIEDADSAINTVDVPFRFYPCLAAGLAYYLAIKKAPDRIQILKAIYDEEFDRAATEDRDRTSLKLLPYERYI